MSKIVLASSNQGKSAEIRQLLAELSIQLVSQSEFGIGDIEETGSTFFENAIIKARHVAALTGWPAIADDSGLVVDSLGGAPGVYSARYAGPGASDADLIAKLLSAMKNKTDEERKASYHCVWVLMRYAKDPAPIIAHGIWHGSILHQPVGTQGFGYDPVFHVPEFNCSAAELSVHEKNKISHRSKAFVEFKTKYHHIMEEIN